MSTLNSSPITLPASAHLAPDVLIDIPKEDTQKDDGQAIIPKMKKKVPWWRPTCEKLIYQVSGAVMAVIFVGLVMGLYKLAEDIREHKNILG